MRRIIEASHRGGVVALPRNVTLRDRVFCSGAEREWLLLNGNAVRRCASFLLVKLATSAASRCPSVTERNTSAPNQTHASWADRLPIGLNVSELTQTLFLSLSLSPSLQRSVEGPYIRSMSTLQIPTTHRWSEKSQHFDEISVFFFVFFFL